MGDARGASGVGDTAAVEDETAVGDAGAGAEAGGGDVAPPPPIVGTVGRTLAADNREDSAVGVGVTKGLGRPGEATNTARRAREVNAAGARTAAVTRNNRARFRVPLPPTILSSYTDKRLKARKMNPRTTLCRGMPLRIAVSGVAWPSQLSFRQRVVRLVNDVQ